MLQDDKTFIERVVQLGREYGWNGDYIEVVSFMQWIYQQYGLAVPPDEHFYPVD